MKPTTSPTAEMAQPREYCDQCGGLTLRSLLTYDRHDGYVCDGCIAEQHQLPGWAVPDDEGTV